jgi:hypothetical protein
MGSQCRKLNPYNTHANPHPLVIKNLNPKKDDFREACGSVLRFFGSVDFSLTLTLTLTWSMSRAQQKSDLKSKRKSPEMLIPSAPVSTTQKFAQKMKAD